RRYPRPRPARAGGRSWARPARRGAGPGPVVGSVTGFLARPRMRLGFGHASEQRLPVAALRTARAAGAQRAAQVVAQVQRQEDRLVLPVEGERLDLGIVAQVLHGRGLVV